MEPKYEEMAQQMRADGVSEEIIARFVAEEMEEDEFRRGKGVTEIEALRERKKIPEHIRKLLLANAFCHNCGTTEFAPGYTLRMRHGCVLVLKGHGTVTAAPTGEVLVNTTGGSGLAKGGSGDVLTGVIASLLAQGVDAVQAAVAGVWLHGRAGDLLEAELTAYGVMPEAVAEHLPPAIREILE